MVDQSVTLGWFPLLRSVGGRLGLYGRFNKNTVVVDGEPAHYRLQFPKLKTLEYFVNPKVQDLYGETLRVMVSYYTTYGTSLGSVGRHVP